MNNTLGNGGAFDPEDHFIFGLTDRHDLTHLGQMPESEFELVNMVNFVAHDDHRL